MLRHLAIFILSLFAALVLAAAAPADAILVLAGDQHSAYERTAQFVAHVEKLKADNPGVPLAVLIDGDAMELGNVVARKSVGEIDLAMFAALARLAPTILNLGNHESEFFDLGEAVRRISATGVNVVSNLQERSTTRPFAPAVHTLSLGSVDAAICGLGTTDVTTYRGDVRDSIEPVDSATWGKSNLPTLLPRATVGIVLSHAGIPIDRELLPVVPNGTLYVGAHNHLRFVHRLGRTVYVHSGSWNEYLTVARLHRTGAESSWDIEQIAIGLDDPADPKLAALIRDTMARHLSSDETRTVGHLPAALGVADAGRLAARAVRKAANVDAAFISNTTFGAGLPGGGISRFAFDACVRFDGTIYVGEFSGVQLRAWLARANQGPDTPFTEREGEVLFADGAADIEPNKRYRVAVTDWVARKADKYLKVAPSNFKELPDLKLKAIVTAALNH